MTITDWVMTVSLTLTIAIYFYFFLGPQLGLFGVVWKARWILIKLSWKAAKLKNRIKLSFILTFCSQKDFLEILNGLDLTEHDKIKKEFFDK